MENSHKVSWPNATDEALRVETQKAFGERSGFCACPAVIAQSDGRRGLVGFPAQAWPDILSEETEQFAKAITEEE